jgi:formylglycine-generating enzyme required for sulfatase activity
MAIACRSIGKRNSKNALNILTSSTRASASGRYRLAATFALLVVFFPICGLCAQVTSQSGTRRAAAPSSRRTAERTRSNPRDGLIYVWIPPGTFMMGCSTGDQACFSEEKPAHRVTLSTGFWMGQAEVTVAAYKRFAGMAEISRHLSSSRSAKNADEGDSMPVVDVTWNEANDYCKWAGGRLPSEAEWEYAARGGTAGSRYGDLDRIAWYQDNSSNTSHPIELQQANAYGLFDMLGNVWEWVNDWYNGNYYSENPAIDPAGPADGKMRVLRGGSWLNPGALVRASDRARSEPDARFNYFGLRCTWTAAPPSH